ncbi:MAG: hypothetical protein AAF590_06905 [Pseudomonadota bacterium]
MGLHTEIYEQPFEKHIANSKQMAFWHRYREASQGSTQTIPKLDVLLADREPGQDTWSFRLLGLPDGDFIYTHHGEALRDTASHSHIGQRASGGTDRASRFFQQCFKQIAQDRRPLFTRSNDVTGNTVATWHSLIVPAEDDVGQLNIVGMQQPVDATIAMLRGALDVIDEPTLVLQLIRDGGQDVVDAQVKDLNPAALEMLGVTSTRHLYTSDFAPYLMDEPFFRGLQIAFTDGERSDLEAPITINGNSFAGFVATPNGDGVVMRLKSVS